MLTLAQARQLSGPAGELRAGLGCDDPGDDDGDDDRDDDDRDDDREEAAPPAFSLSPGTFTGIDGNGAAVYSYDFGAVARATQTFTVTNNNGDVGLISLAAAAERAFSLTNDRCTGSSTGQGLRCTFDLTFTATAGCTPNDTFDTEVAVQVRGAPVISLDASGACPPGTGR
jgi:hypothetical protein